MDTGVASENIECGTGRSYFLYFQFLDMVLSSSMNKLLSGLRIWGFCKYEGVRTRTIIQHYLLSLSECRRPWIHKVRIKK